MAAKLRPRVSLPDSGRARPPARLKPAAVSFGGLCGGGLRYEAARSVSCRHVRRGLPLQRKMLQAPDHDAVRIDGSVTPLGSDVRRRAQQLLANDSTLQASDRRAEAEVPSTTESHMVLAVFAIETERVGVFHVRCVSVRGRPEEHEAIPGMEVESRERPTPPHPPIVKVEGRVETTALFHESRNEFWSPAEDASDLGVLREVLHDVADEGCRRVASRREHCGGDTDRCVAWNTAVLDGRGERGQKWSALV